MCEQLLRCQIFPCKCPYQRKDICWVGWAASFSVSTLCAWRMPMVAMTLRQFCCSPWSPEWMYFQAHKHCRPDTDCYCRPIPLTGNTEYKGLARSQNAAWQEVWSRRQTHLLNEHALWEEMPIPCAAGNREEIRRYWLAPSGGEEKPDYSSHENIGCMSSLNGQELPIITFSWCQQHRFHPTPVQHCEKWQRLFHSILWCVCFF